MKETRFIAQNKEKWQESENLLRESEKDPEKLSNLFIQVIDDLSFSRTYYPNRSVRVYLNRIAREYFSIIYSHHKSKKNAFRIFWLEELPQIICKSRIPLLISLKIFLLAAAIGIFSSMKDPQFTSTILGENYVNMTKANIEKGDPMAVYKEAHQVDMFLGITMNNLMVAFRTYVFGVFFSIGTIAILLYNGIMVGCFQFFFIERGLLAESALTIWLHGTIEISCIIIAGGAGLTLGSGLLFPGTYSRLQAFQITAMRSLKIMLGITPLFVLAAVIESFLTRYTDVPDVLRLLLIVLSAVLIVGYFVVYPWMKSRTGFRHPLEEVRLPATRDGDISISQIKNNGEIIRDSFTFYRRYLRQLVLWIATITLIAATAEFFSAEERTYYVIPMDGLLSLFNEMYYALKTTSPFFILVNAVAVSAILYRVFSLILKDAKQRYRPKIVPVIQLLMVFGMVFALLYFFGGWGTLLLVLSYNMFLLLAFQQFAERKLLPSSFFRTWQLCAENLGQVMALQLIILMMSVSFLLILSAPLLYFNLNVVEWNFAASDAWAMSIIEFVQIYLKLFAFNLLLPVFGCSAAYLYFSSREISSADSLKEAISRIHEKYPGGANA